MAAWDSSIFYKNMHYLSLYKIVIHVSFIQDIFGFIELIVIFLWFYLHDRHK